MSMAKSHSHSWTPEKLGLESRKRLETIRKNAVRLGASDLVELCDNELKSRRPQKEKRNQHAQSQHSETDFVIEYHFVCARDRGVTETKDGRFWSGSWVVAESNVRNSLKYGAYLALHESRSNPSYRQGQILNYRRSTRDMFSKSEQGLKVEEGIEFLVQRTNEPYAWVGTGSGEKGYRWAKIADAPSSEPAQNEVPS